MRIPQGPPELQSAFREVWAALDPLLTSNLDLHGRRAINAGNGTAPQDYVTKAQLDAIGALATNTAPSATAIENVDLLYGLHSERAAAAPGRQRDGTLFVETDRHAVYQVEGGQWVIVSAYFIVSAVASRPADLSTNDATFLCADKGTGITWRWSGAQWKYHHGTIRDVYANRPTAVSDTVDGGVIFEATDMGGQAWIYVNDGTGWVLLEGWGGPQAGTWPGGAPALGTADAGFLFNGTNFDRVWRFTGTVWSDAPGQPSRGMIVFFQAIDAPSVGWALCDGSVVTMSTTGGTGSVTTPNLTGSNRFLRSVSGTTGGTGGSATTHTHSVDPPLQTFNTATESGDQFVKAGTAADLLSPNANHTHAVDVNISAVTSAAPSGAGGDDALPPYYNARPYIRL